MSLLTIVMALAAASAGLAPQSSEATVHRLRHVAAADAAHALTAFLAPTHSGATVAAEPVSNTVLVAGTPAERRQAADLLAVMDREPQAVNIQMTFVRVPVAFFEEVGLGEGQKWVLTPRETRLLSAAIRGAEGREFLARPGMMATDNQTVSVQTGAEAREAPAITARVLPRVSADGTAVLLRLEAQLTETTGAASNIQSIRTTESVPAGGTMVVRGPRTKAVGEGATDLLVMATVERVRPQAGQ